MKKFLLLLTFIMFQGLIAAPIHDAVWRGDLDKVKRILNQNFVSKYLDGTDVNAIDYHRGTPLHFASDEGHAEIVEMLIDAGANVNAVDISGKSPLHFAANKGHAEIVEMLIDAGANVNAVDIYGESPLHFASDEGQTKIVQLLIEAGANVNAVDKIGRTPLHSAVFFDRAEIVEILIRHGANVNAVDIYGSTPLHKSTFCDCAEIVKMLLEDPLCDHTITDNNNETPEETTRRFPCHQEIADMLHNASSIMQKVFNSGKGLQLSAARVANKEGVYEEDYNELGTSVKHYITNIRKDKKPSYLEEDEAGPSGYHSDGDVSSIATEDLEEELQQQSYCSIQ